MPIKEKDNVSWLKKAPEKYEPENDAFLIFGIGAMFGAGIALIVMLVI